MIDYAVDADGIATLTWNVADRPMNVINRDSTAAFDAAVKRAIADEKVKGVIVTSSRPEFLAGGDLDLIRDIQTAEQSAAASGPFSATLRLLEKSGKPFVAAINGTALGGGLEICLACHRRIVADDPKIQLGLPEVTLGLLPGAGGTQRLPRMIGIRKSLPYLLEGRKVAPAVALQEGIVDEVVPAAGLLARSKEWLLSEGPQGAVKPWDAKGFKFPGGGPQTPATTQLFFGVSAQILNKTQGLYPAPEAILACLYDGCHVDLDNALKIEQHQFARLATSAATKNMIRTLFYSMGDANRLADRPKSVPTRRYKKVGILGAGMMGAGVAHVSALAGIEVVLLDTTVEAAERGKAYSAKLLDAQVAKSRLAADKRDRTLALIRPATEFTALSDCDMIIEAVFEDREVKADVTRKAESAMSADAVFASNTSTLPITGLAEVSSRPDRFVGLHFFSPVEKMPLVEVIRGKKTSEATVAQAMDFVKQIRKTPIVVNDCPSFYANRAFSMFPYEAMTMLGEGVNPDLIENAARLAGMPMPALALVDEFSLELMHKVYKQARLDQGKNYKEQPQDEVLVTMVEKLGRIGRKAGKGFYEYPADGKKRLWPGLAEHFPLAEEQPTLEEVRKRLMYSQSIEAARCIAEGICSIKDADVGSLLGWGFPAALGGAVSHIDTVGANRFVAESDRLAKAYGPRFEVPPALREMAESNARYHVS
ncbi:MAG: enoyl-CoA hydratase/isomerase family protein [Proteobacteria bacterium]|nr:enoyl-CoA hydratase/isomerase family protein [Pseudomonadota bacterium]